MKKIHPEKFIGYVNIDNTGGWECDELPDYFTIPETEL